MAAGGGCGVRGCRPMEAGALLPAPRGRHGGGGAARMSRGARRGGAARCLDPRQDRGVGARLGPEHFFLTTTTGNAAAVLDWLEEWLQTEWPELDVFCTSVTEEWANATLVGWASRDVLTRLAPELALDSAAFPHMTMREADLG